MISIFEGDMTHLRSPINSPITVHRNHQIILCFGKMVLQYLHSSHYLTHHSSPISPILFMLKSVDCVFHEYPIMDPGTSDCIPGFTIQLESSPSLIHIYPISQNNINFLCYNQYAHKTPLFAVLHSYELLQIIPFKVVPQ